MSRPRTVGDLIPTRRELLKYGGLGLVGASLDGVWPLKLHAADSGRKTNPRGNARNVIFFEISGAISHLDTFDFKENIATPKDFEVQKIDTGIHFPVSLFPRMKNLMNRIAIQRSFVSHEEVHLRGQYYLQAGRQLNVAFAREIPSVGSVVASELEQFRRNSDTFPTYMSFNLETNQVGALATGFLPPNFAVFDLNAQAALTGMSLDEKAVELIEERWRVLSRLREVRGSMSSYGRDVASFEGYSDTAKRLLTDSRWPPTFRVTDEDRKRYGNSGVGIASALARNVLAQDAGTRYIHICQHGWDHHKHIWDHSNPDSHYKLIGDFDPAAASLIEDLATTPSKATPGKMLLDETLVVMMSEFGRTPGPLNHMAGRDHHKYVFPAMFAGAGVKGGLVLGASDSDGRACVDTGWKHKVQPRIENVVSTIYSALGIDWAKEVRNLPSGRTYSYVDALGANGTIPTDDLTNIYG